jgi:hypothetical protein
MISTVSHHSKAAERPAILMGQHVELVNSGWGWPATLLHNITGTTGGDILAHIATSLYTKFVG